MPSNNNSSASKSIFNASFKELKPSKSVDLTQSILNSGDNSTMIQNSLFNNEEAENFELFLFNKLDFAFSNSKVAMLLKIEAKKSRADQFYLWGKLVEKSSGFRQLYLVLTSPSKYIY